MKIILSVFCLCMMFCASASMSAEDCLLTEEKIEMESLVYNPPKPLIMIFRMEAVEVKKVKKIRIRMEVRLRNAHREMRAESLTIRVKLPNEMVFQRSGPDNKPIFWIPTMPGKYEVSVTAYQSGWEIAKRRKTFKIKCR